MQGRIEVHLQASDAVIRLEVLDAGSGIPADQVSRVFERFHRVEVGRDAHTKAAVPGLTLVDEFARLHGGRVSVHSELNVGSPLGLWVSAGILRTHGADVRVRSKGTGKTTGTIFSMLFPKDALLKTNT